MTYHSRLNHEILEYHLYIGLLSREFHVNPALSLRDEEIAGQFHQCPGSISSGCMDRAADVIRLNGSSVSPDSQGLQVSRKYRQDKLFRWT